MLYETSLAEIVEKKYLEAIEHNVSLLFTQVESPNANETTVICSVSIVDQLEITR
jgi:hypothetical protein